MLLSTFQSWAATSSHHILKAINDGETASADYPCMLDRGLLAWGDIVNWRGRAHHSCTGGYHRASKVIRGGKACRSGKENADDVGNGSIGVTVTAIGVIALRQQDAATAPAQVAKQMPASSYTELSTVSAASTAVASEVEVSKQRVNDYLAIHRQFANSSALRAASTTQAEPRQAAAQ